MKGMQYIFPLFEELQPQNRKHNTTWGYDRR